LTATERHQLLREHNDTALALPPLVSLHQGLERQAAQSPEALAVICGATTLTYGQLHRQADQLAPQPPAPAAGPHRRAGPLLRRSARLPVALFGALKAGSAYVPLDPTYPAERLAFMMEDADLVLVLTEEDLATQLPTGALARQRVVGWEELRRSAAEGSA